MTEKRFNCHQMIADYTTTEDVDFDFLLKLINEQKQPLDLTMHICDGNKDLTYRECVDLLNENEQLKSENNDLRFEKEKWYRKSQQLEQMLKDVER